MKIVLWFVYLLSLYFAIFWFLALFDETQKKAKPKIKKFSFVSLIIPAHNEEKRIIPTLKSALNLDYPKSKIEFIVIDDGSTDKTAALVEDFISKHPEVRLVRQKNKGKGPALNHGLKLSKGEYFICLDADSYVKRNALKIILPHFGDNVAAVLPILKVRKPKNLLQKMQWYEYIINVFYKWLMGKLDCVHVAPGPFSVYKKSILEKVGGFDEDHNLVEDMEIVLRFQSRHYKVIQLLDAEVNTIAPKSLKELYKQRNRWYKGGIYNALKYRRMIFNKEFGDFGMIQVPSIILAGVLALTLILSLIYYTFKPYVAYIYNLSFVGFDFMTFIRNFRFSFHILDLNYSLILVAVFMLVISMIILKKAHTHVKEKVTKYNLLPILIYIFTYFILLGVMWIGITFDMLLGKKQRW